MAEPRDDHSLVESILNSDYRPESPEARARLLDLLASAAVTPNRVARSLAASRLWFIKDAGPLVENLIKTLLLDDDDHVRLKAAMSAMRVSDRCKDDLAPQIVPILLDAAKREEGLSRTKVIQCLGKFPHFADAILPTLIEALGSDNPRERYCASTSLGRLGAAALLAAEPIRRAIEREVGYWVDPDGTIDLRIVHAETLFKVIGDNAWSRAAATERLRDAEASEGIRRGARLLLEALDGPRRT